MLDDPDLDQFFGPSESDLDILRRYGHGGLQLFHTNGPDGTCFPAFGTTVTSYGGQRPELVRGMTFWG